MKLYEQEYYVLNLGSLKLFKDFQNSKLKKGNVTFIEIQLNKS